MSGKRVEDGRLALGELTQGQFAFAQPSLRLLARGGLAEDGDPAGARTIGVGHRRQVYLRPEFAAVFAVGDHLDAHRLARGDGAAQRSDRGGIGAVAMQELQRTAEDLRCGVARHRAERAIDVDDPRVLARCLRGLRDHHRVVRVQHDRLQESDALFRPLACEEIAHPAGEPTDGLGDLAHLARRSAEQEAQTEFRLGILERHAQETAKTMIERGRGQRMKLAIERRQIGDRGKPLLRDRSADDRRVLGMHGIAAEEFEVAAEVELGSRIYRFELAPRRLRGQSIGKRAIGRHMLGDEL